MKEQLIQYKNVIENLKKYDQNISLQTKIEIKICIVEEKEDKVFIKKEIKYGKRI